MTAPNCPECNAPMRERSGTRGPFWGCSRYRDGCRGTRQIGATTTTGAAGGRPPQSAAPSNARTESAGPAAELVDDLRKAIQHLGSAAHLLERRRPEIEKLLAAADDEVPF